MHPETHRKRFFIGIVLGGILATAGLSFLGSGLTAYSEGQAVNKKEAAAQPKHDQHPAASVDVGSARDRGKLMPGFRAGGLPPVPVEVPDGPPKLAWKMVKGVKEFHLTAEHLKREVLPDVWIDVWGYNGSMPGPMIEAVEGDTVRIIVHNKLPEATSLHWHGIDVPNAMDGVEGLVQNPIPAGGTYTYEFTLKQNGTFFYHTHVAMQQSMGMVGLFIIHPKVAHYPQMDPKMKTDDTMKRDKGKDPHAGHGGTAKIVPGFPQSMGAMSTYSAKEVEKLNRKWQTRGMRKHWYAGVEGLMTVVRVLPPKLYDRVVGGKDVPADASVPGSMPGMDHDKHKRP